MGGTYINLHKFMLFDMTVLILYMTHVDMTILELLDVTENIQKTLTILEYARGY